MTCSQHVLFTFNNLLEFPPCICYMLDSSQLFHRGPRKKASMDPLRISIKLQWTHEVSLNSRGFSGQSIRILFQVPEEIHAFSVDFPISRESMHFFQVFLGDPCNFMWFSVDLPNFFWGIHAIFGGFSQVFPRNPCMFRGFSQVFLGSACILRAIFCRFCEMAQKMWLMMDDVIVDEVCLVFLSLGSCPLMSIPSWWSSPLLPPMMIMITVTSCFSWWSYSLNNNDSWWWCVLKSL